MRKSQKNNQTIDCHLPLIIDTREQAPFFYDKLSHPDYQDPPIQLIHTSLKTGDYSIKGFEDFITIERKSLSDLYQSIGRGRARFQREFERMSQLQFAAVVIEADLETITTNPPPTTQMSPKSVFRTIVTWCQRYRIPFFPCPNRSFAEKTTYLLLKSFWQDHSVAMRGAAA